MNTENSIFKNFVNFRFKFHYPLSQLEDKEYWIAGSDFYQWFEISHNYHLGLKSMGFIPQAGSKLATENDPYKPFYPSLIKAFALKASALTLCALGAFITF